MKALILVPFHPPSLERLKARVNYIHNSWTETRNLISPEELIDYIENKDCSIVIIEADFIFDDVFDNTNKLKLVGISRSAVNHVDIEAATQHGVAVINTPGRNAVSVAELTVGLFLSLARRIPTAHTLVQSGKWEDPVEPYISLRGVELAGKIAGIIGFGVIGSEVGKRLSAFDMKVLAYDPFVSPEKMSHFGAINTPLHTLLKESDFITIHATASLETAGLIGASEMALMKPTAYLINTADWEIIDEPALLQVLQSRKIAGAAFDIFQTHPVPPDSPLLKMDNVILTPHIGGATDGAIVRYSRMMIEDIERFLDGKRPQNLVNPEVWH